MGGLAASAQLHVRGMYLRSLCEEPVCVCACVCQGGGHIHIPELTPLLGFFGYRVLQVLKAASILENFQRCFSEA